MTFATFCPFFIPGNMFGHAGGKRCLETLQEHVLSSVQTFDENSLLTKKHKGLLADFRIKGSDLEIHTGCFLQHVI